MLKHITFKTRPDKNTNIININKIIGHIHANNRKTFVASCRLSSAVAKGQSHCFWQHGDGSESRYNHSDLLAMCT